MNRRHIALIAGLAPVVALMGVIDKPHADFFAGVCGFLIGLALVLFICRSRLAAQ